MCIYDLHHNLNKAHDNVLGF
uniref:Uncharacterized protein n=1 Tax=Anguilla anguilla TaxID=7936 RepID=A0A0E9T485_ANGAN